MQPAKPEAAIRGDYHDAITAGAALRAHYFHQIGMRAMMPVARNV
jgi:hypothetical protein